MNLSIYKKLFLLINFAFSLGINSLQAKYHLILRRNDGTNTFIALYDGKKQLGRVDINHKGKKGFIHDIYIDREMRSKGIGGKLFKFTIAFMAALGCKKIEFKACPTTIPASAVDKERVEALNQLIKFYIKQGCYFATEDIEKEQVEIQSDTGIKRKIVLVKRDMYYIPMTTPQFVLIDGKIYHLPSTYEDKILQEYFLQFIPKNKDFIVAAELNTLDSLQPGSSQNYNSEEGKNIAIKLLETYCYKYFKS